ncbi:hypothetical protein HNE05_18155 [Aquipseudomonas campi]|uniref:Uncharacterized protein n=1 Tax=Aquipseudomonas campi TaxID=2731681 RepID=A0A6M8FKN3_9GAMM|nr:hypothetical protein [Pseudomonas campi]QKE65197.1 hypothetical protein HNE05_18155 [Pseudomonas campi]
MRFYFCYNITNTLSNTPPNSDAVAAATWLRFASQQNELKHRSGSTNLVAQTLPRLAMDNGFHVELPRTRTFVIQATAGQLTNKRQIELNMQAKVANTRPSSNY